MVSWSAAIVRIYVENVRRSKITFGNVRAVEASIKDLYLHPQSFTPSNNLGPDISFERVDINAWPLYCVSFKNNGTQVAQQESRKAILYVHGGAYYREIDPFHWKFIAQLARDTNLKVLVPIYPLVPRPTATAAQVVEGVIDICRDSRHEVICIAGDSAGGAIALATVQQMSKIATETALKLRSDVLISPVLDCAFDHPENLRLAPDDPWLAIDGLQKVAPIWAGDLPIKDARVSPLYGSIDDLPPILLFAGTADLLCADARRLSARFQGKTADDVVEGSVEVFGFTYVERRDMIHVYPILPHWQGAEAREQIVAFIKKH